MDNSHYACWGMAVVVRDPDKPNPWKEFLKTKGDGIHHVGFQVRDVEEVNEHSVSEIFRAGAYESVIMLEKE